MFGIKYYLVKVVDGKYKVDLSILCRSKKETDEFFYLGNIKDENAVAFEEGEVAFLMAKLLHLKVLTMLE